MNRFTALLAGLVMSCASAAEKDIVIAVGSCLVQDRPMDIFDALTDTNPVRFLMLGDNVYADTDDPKVFASVYRKLGANNKFQRFRESTRILPTWDDHDYGATDGGGDFKAKDIAKEAFLSFWNQEQLTDVKNNPDGIYYQRVLNQLGLNIQIILLDTRWNRSPLYEVEDPEIKEQRTANKTGHFKINQGDHHEFLGETQWRWLEQQLMKKADIRIIASSIQFIAEFTGWESWANFPAERQRLLKLLNKTKASGVIIASGDVHRAEISRLDKALPYPLWEITASGLDAKVYPQAPNIHRVGDAFIGLNFGTITIKDSQTKPRVQLAIHDVDGEVMQLHSIPLADLSYQ